MPRYIGATNTAAITAGANFTAGNQSRGSLYDFLKAMGGEKGSAAAAFSLMDVYTQVKANNWSFEANAQAQTPTAGGTCTINSQTVSAGYDYTVHTGNVTVSSYSNGDFFTSTADSRVACIHITGNLTINLGQTFIPGVRKPGAYIYVGGDLVLNGEISMKARGANHSGSGSNLTAVNIRIIDGSHGTYTDPTIPAAGGTGGARTSAGSGPGNAQANVGYFSPMVNFGTGGGQHGIAFAERSSATAGKGGDGTCFTGGSGGGSVRGAGAPAQYGGVGTGGDCEERGGKGGNSAANFYSCNGSAGNPHGNPGQGSWGPSRATGGNSGTGGVIVIFVRGSVSGSGTLNVQGENQINQGPQGGRGPGQGSAAGMVSCFCDSYSGSGITIKRHNGEWEWNSWVLTGIGTDDTASGNPTTLRGGTKGGFGQIIPTTLT